MKQDFTETLKVLGKQAKQEAKQRAEQLAKQQEQAKEEVDFFALMHDVKPIKNSQRYEAPRDLSPIKRREHDPQLDDSQFFYVGEGQNVHIPKVFSKNGQGQNDIRRLQSGYYEVVADVDLHGYNQDEAQQVLNEFIEFVQKRGVCGEIVHGSGLGSSGYQPVLKNLVRRWLMAHPDVLAYAEPHAHNDGAVRILLKRRRRQQDEKYEF